MDSVRVSYAVLSEYVNTPEEWWSYWLSKLIGKYASGRLVVSGIAAMFAERCGYRSYLIRNDLLKKRIHKSSRFYVIGEYRGEMNLRVVSDGALLGTDYPDALLIPVDSLSRLATFRKAIVRSAAMRYEFVSLEKMAGELSIDRRTVARFTQDLEKIKVYERLRNPEILPSHAFTRSHNYFYAPRGVHVKRTDEYASRRGHVQRERWGDKLTFDGHENAGNVVFERNATARPVKRKYQRAGDLAHDAQGGNGAAVNELLKRITAFGK